MVVVGVLLHSLEIFWDWKKETAEEDTYIRLPKIQLYIQSRRQTKCLLVITDAPMASCNPCSWTYVLHHVRRCMSYCETTVELVMTRKVCCLFFWLDNKKDDFRILDRSDDFCVRLLSMLIIPFITQGVINFCYLAAN